MFIKIANKNLGKTMQLLINLDLKGRKSRMRTRVVRLIEQQLERVSKEEHDMLVEYCKIDGNGHPKITEEGIWDLKDEVSMEEFVKDRTEFSTEEVLIGGPEYKDALESVGDSLLNSEETYSGEEAFFYDEICELFEETIAEYNKTN